MDVYTLLANLRERGILLISDGDKLIAESASRLSDADRAAIRQSKSDLLRILLKGKKAPEHVIEAIFSIVTATSRDVAVNQEFTACPDCKIARYWITANGKVVCGKCGTVRFQLTNIAYQAAN
jgi:hypothetical protein